MKTKPPLLTAAMFRWLAILALSFTVGVANAAQPVVSNVRAAQRAGTQLVDVYYDLASASNALMVSVMVSTNGGASYTVPATSFTGAVGAGIATGTNRKITWNAGQDWPTNFSANVRFRVTADDANVPSGMALIPVGSFTMGAETNVGHESYGGETPQHTVYVSAFYMDKYDVTKTLWDSVYQWAITHGYSFDYAGSGKAANHPVQTIDWWDAVKWCNARSEKEGLNFCYYTSAAQTTVYRSGQVNLTNACVNWVANGYRLPTEAEWEKSARGGLSGQRFPWGDIISHSLANYYGNTGLFAYDLGPNGYNTNYTSGGSPYTSPVGSFAPNGYGLYDMAGNVWQWCWDWYDGSWYSNAGATQSDTRGPASSPYSRRVLRGGHWDLSGGGGVARCAERYYGGPSSAYSVIGFRCVRGL